MRIAESLDAVHQRNNMFSTSNQQNTSNHPQPMDLGAIQHNQYHPRPSHFPSRSPRKEEDFKSGACFFCHKQGHQARMCPAKSRSSSSPSSTTMSSARVSHGNRINPHTRPSIAVIQRWNSGPYVRHQRRQLEHFPRASESPCLSSVSCPVQVQDSSPGVTSQEEEKNGSATRPIVLSSSEEDADKK